VLLVLFVDDAPWAFPLLLFIEPKIVGTAERDVFPPDAFQESQEQEPVRATSPRIFIKLAGKGGFVVEWCVSPFLSLLGARGSAAATLLLRSIFSGADWLQSVFPVSSIAAEEPGILLLWAEPLVKEALLLCVASDTVAIIVEFNIS
jgi:hypothetical protein